MTEPSAIALDITLRQAIQGDAQAWANLVEAYTSRVFGLLLKQCGDRELAEELTQDTFVKIFEKLSQQKGYDERGRFESWLFRIAMNKLRDEMRRRKRQARSMDMSPSSSADNPSGWAAVEQGVVQRQPGSPSDPLEKMDRQEQLDQVRSLVSELGQADQKILYLRHTAGLSFTQIAQTLEQPLGTVLARGHRVLGKLRKRMADLDEIDRLKKV